MWETGVTFEEIPRKRRINEIHAIAPRSRADTINRPMVPAPLMTDEPMSDKADFVLVDLGMLLNREGKSLAEVFEAMDEDGSKTIEPDEFRKGLLKLGIAELDESEIDRIIAAVDLDGDGEIDLLELHNAFNEHNMPTRIVGAAADAPRAAGPTPEGFRPWTERGASKMALLFPDMEAFQDATNARVISGLSMLGLVLFWWNAVSGIARATAGGARDHSIDLMMMISGASHNAAPAPHLDALSTLFMIVIVYVMFLSSPTFIVALVAGLLMAIGGMMAGGTLSWVIAIAGVGLAVWGGMEMRNHMPEEGAASAGSESSEKSRSGEDAAEEE